MGIEEGGRMTARAALYERIDRLEAEFQGLPAGVVAAQVDDIRRLARDTGFPALADLAYGAERQIARAPGTASLGPWIVALKEATGCDALDSAAVGGWLASLGQAAR